MISYIFDIYKWRAVKSACYSNYYRCNIDKDGVEENTFPHRSTGEPVIGLGPRPAKVALWKGIFFHSEFSESILRILVNQKAALTQQPPHDK